MDGMTSQCGKNSYEPKRACMKCSVDAGPIEVGSYLMPRLDCRSMTFRNEKKNINVWGLIKMVWELKEMMWWIKKITGKRTDFELGSFGNNLVTLWLFVWVRILGALCFVISKSKNMEWKIRIGTRGGLWLNFFWKIFTKKWRLLQNII